MGIIGANRILFKGSSVVIYRDYDKTEAYLSGDDRFELREWTRVAGNGDVWGRTSHFKDTVGIFEGMREESKTPNFEYYVSTINTEIGKAIEFFESQKKKREIKLQQFLYKKQKIDLENKRKQEEYSNRKPLQQDEQLDIFNYKNKTS